MPVSYDSPEDFGKAYSLPGGLVPHPPPYPSFLPTQLAVAPYFQALPPQDIVPIPKQDLKRLKDSLEVVADIARMADPLSVLASLIAVSSAALKISKSLYSIAGALKSSVDDIERLAFELDTFSSVLEELRDWLEDHQELISKSALETANKILRRCKKTFADIKRLVGTGADNNFDPPTFWAKIRFVFQHQRIEPLRANLESCRSTLALQLSLFKLAEFKKTPSPDEPSMLLSSEEKKLRTRVEHSVVVTQHSLVRLQRAEFQAQYVPGPAAFHPSQDSRWLLKLVPSLQLPRALQSPFPMLPDPQRVRKEKAEEKRRMKQTVENLLLNWTNLEETGKRHTGSKISFNTHDEIIDNRDVVSASSGQAMGTAYKDNVPKTFLEPDPQASKLGNPALPLRPTDSVHLVASEASSSQRPSRDATLPSQVTSPQADTESSESDPVYDLPDLHEGYDRQPDDDRAHTVDSDGVTMKEVQDDLGNPPNTPSAVSDVRRRHSSTGRRSQYGFDPSRHSPEQQIRRHQRRGGRHAHIEITHVPSEEENQSPDASQAADESDDSIEKFLNRSFGQDGYSQSSLPAPVVPSVAQPHAIMAPYPPLYAPTNPTQSPYPPSGPYMGYGYRPGELYQDAHGRSQYMAGGGMPYAHAPGAGGGLEPPRQYPYFPPPLVPSPSLSSATSTTDWDEGANMKPPSRHQSRRNSLDLDKVEMLRRFAELLRPDTRQNVHDGPEAVLSAEPGGPSGVNGRPDTPIVKAGSETHNLEAEKEATLKFVSADWRIFRFPYSRCKTWQDTKNLIQKIHRQSHPDLDLDDHESFSLADREGNLVLPEHWEDTVKPGTTIMLLLAKKTSELGVLGGPGEQDTPAEKRPAISSTFHTIGDAEAETEAGSKKTKHSRDGRKERPFRDSARLKSLPRALTPPPAIPNDDFSSAEECSYSSGEERYEKTAAVREAEMQSRSFIQEGDVLWKDLKQHCNQLMAAESSFAKTRAKRKLAHIMYRESSSEYQQQGVDIHDLGEGPDVQSRVSEKKSGMRHGHEGRRYGRQSRQLRTGSIDPPVHPPAGSLYLTPGYQPHYITYSPNLPVFQEGFEEEGPTTPSLLADPASFRRYEAAGLNQKTTVEAKLDYLTALLEKRGQPSHPTVDEAKSQASRNERTSYVPRSVSASSSPALLSNESATQQTVGNTTARPSVPGGGVGSQGNSPGRRSFRRRWLGRSFSSSVV
ncbi:hypothetical protein A1O3_03441 [Capronia epimyces CBS 606.96]|uniref:Fungal N-terminal domain-containing protein n=1 Tax=Capronia epimyces CBS 606.96 TaxID=1182542 RepID=W9YA22_9EURO|nr:uncharacterized protein A1O3_03441 [Capronia epimyces CBS 606.96]EXJ86490.1 hypothetical protein A1O3_03441 [Capronia epimyces CBS 606.96]